MPPVEHSADAGTPESQPRSDTAAAKTELKSDADAEALRNMAAAQTAVTAAAPAAPALPEASTPALLAAPSPVPPMDVLGGNMLRQPRPSTAAPPGVAAMEEPTPQPGYHDQGRDRFQTIETNPVKVTAEEPVSTFSIDVDTSSYSFMRASLNNGALPPDDAVRVEELVNYFPYDYPGPDSADAPFKASVTVMPTPWNAGTKLVDIGIKGFDIAPAARPHANLVFLIDTSGSMDEPNKLPLLINSMKLLVGELQPDDTVAIVTYAGSAGTVLEPTKASEKGKIDAALENLSAGGSTAGAEGIRQAYQLAEQNFDKNGVNRVILATDGDFNVGITDTDELEGFIERERTSGIFLSVLGFGRGNYNDALMQALAQNGNGAAAYIDTLSEARKVLVEESTSTLFPIAKDVKIQVEFNPATVVRIPADRLRDAAPQSRRLQQRQGRRRRDRLRPHGDGALRDHAGGERRASGRRSALSEQRGAGGFRYRGQERRIRVPQDPLQAAGRGHEPADRDADLDGRRGQRHRRRNGRARGALRGFRRGVRADPARRPLHRRLRLRRRDRARQRQQGRGRRSATGPSS